MRHPPVWAAIAIAIAANANAVCCSLRPSEERSMLGGQSQALERKFVSHHTMLSRVSLLCTLQSITPASLTPAKCCLSEVGSCGVKHGGKLSGTTSMPQKSLLQVMLDAFSRLDAQEKPTHPNSTLIYGTAPSRDLRIL